MNANARSTSAVSDRVRELIALYDHPRASAAWLLCDRHASESMAYRLVGRELNASDLSYSELRSESERFAAVLASLGIQPGDRVATLMGKSREYLITLMGIWRLGAVHVPLFTAFAPAAIAFRLIHSDATVVVCDSAQRPKLSPGEDMPSSAAWRVINVGGDERDGLDFHALMAAARPGIKAAALGGDAPIIQIYTSGTTGKPKGVIVPTKALAAFHVYAEFGLDLRPGDVYWCAADPGWAYGLYFGVLGSFTTGVPGLLLESGFSTETTFAVLANQGVTNFAAAPTVYRALRAWQGRIPGRLQLRCASSAGEPLTPEVNEWATAALGVTVHDHYGQTEAGMLINNHHHPQLRRSLKSGSMGHAMPGWQPVILSETSDDLAAANEMGRVAMDLTESPLAWFKCYFGDPEKSAEKFAGDGRWYLTGDVGWADEQGYFHFCSRDDDVIIMAGYRIGPFEVESVIAAHPAVVECAVIAAPDAVRGEVIEAYVVLRDPASASRALGTEIQEWVKKRYAAHAYPRAVHFAEALPKTQSGKIQRAVLRKQRHAELAGQR